MEHDPDVHSLKCPKCQHGMHEIDHEGVIRHKGHGGPGMDEALRECLAAAKRARR